MSFIIDPTFPPDIQSPRLGAQDIRSITATILSLFGFSGVIAETIADPPGPQVDTNTGLFLVPSMPGASHLRIVPDVTNPTTTMDVTADFVYMLNTTTFTNVNASAFSANCVIVGSQSGSQQNGRDQASAFTSSSFFHLYAIGGGGQSPATVASATAPPTGPALPTSYTSWAYLGTYQLNGSNLFPFYTLGNTVYAQTGFSSFSGLNSTTSDSLSVTNAPTQASSLLLNFNIRVSCNNVALGTLANFCIGVVNPVTFSTAYAVCSIPASGSTSTAGAAFQVEIPNISATLYYLWQLNGMTGPAGTGSLYAYRVPNGST